MPTSTISLRATLLFLVTSAVCATASMLARSSRLPTGALERWRVAFEQTARHDTDRQHWDRRYADRGYWDQRYWDMRDQQRFDELRYWERPGRRAASGRSPRAEPLRGP
jgi:hypothetical protein